MFSDGVLQYFERVADASPKGQISVEEMTGVAPLNESTKASSSNQVLNFDRIEKDRRPNTFEIQTSGKRNYIFSAETTSDFNRVEIVRTCLYLILPSG